MATETELIAHAAGTWAMPETEALEEVAATVPGSVTITITPNTAWIAIT